MPSLSGTSLTARTVYYQFANGKLYILIGYGYYTSPSYYEIYESTYDGQTRTLKYTSQSVYEDTYMVNFIPQYNSLVVCGRKSGGVPFIDLVNINNWTSTSITAPDGQYVTDVIWFNGNLVILCAGLSSSTGKDIKDFFVSTVQNLTTPSNWVRITNPKPDFDNNYHELRASCYGNYLYILGVDKGYNGYVIRWDGETFDNIDSWTGSGTARGFIFPRISSNDTFVAYAKAVDNNGFHVMVSNNGTTFNEVSLLPFFDSSIQGENHCNVHVLSDSVIAIVMSKDSCSANYVRIIDSSGNTLYEEGVGVGHGGVKTTLNGRYYIDWENLTSSSVGIYIVSPDTLKTCSLTVNGNQVSINGTNVTSFKVYRNFSGQGQGNIITSGSIPSTITLSQGFYRVVAR